MIVEALTQTPKLPLYKASRSSTYIDSSKLYTNIYIKIDSVRPIPQTLETYCMRQVGIFEDIIHASDMAKPWSVTSGTSHISLQRPLLGTNIPEPWIEADTLNFLFLGWRFCRELHFRQ